MKRHYSVVDLFSGVGGFSLGFKMLGFDITLANEIDEGIADAFTKNHKETIMLNEDISKIDLNHLAKELKDTDIVIGGPPCQGFSQKGQRKTIIDERNYLYKYFFKFVEATKPSYFVIENVPNLLTAQNGTFRKEIYKIFESIGYSLNSGVLNASDFGVPQHRKRAFIIGSLFNRVVPLPQPNNNFTSAWEAISDLSYLQSGEGDHESNYEYPPSNDYQTRMRKNSCKLYNHVVTNHSKIALERMSLVPENGGRNNLPENHHTKSIYSGTWGRIYKDKPSVTITTRFDTPSSGRFTHPVLNRAITVREAARLQSFPDDFIFYGTKTSQMKQVGNAVPPLLAREIAQVIKHDIERGI
ncbi:DNA cytosine methyltransferase [Salinicoccus roseus]|uniref:DNA cytosine methyltransferase n=1 Tax=Salinicoccus roseus TaxID=45670 RepID=UPI001CA6648E|nr:DNA cytosine methyltransferase [Salinicoccus roseus]MBY8908259.1 DNA cytosine methyltransferase [Salinicoccus roseus]